MKNWKETTLGTYAKVQGGFAFKSKDFQTSGVPVVKIKNVRHRDIDMSELNKVSIEVAETARQYYVKTGDVLISMTGSGLQAPDSIVGRVARHTGNDDEFLINQRVGRFIITSTKELHKRFLYYYLSQKSIQWELVSIATGSANQVNISAKQIESLVIPVPPLLEQKTITHILGTLDDKIELNRRMNETLEAMARTISKSWFVDFDPVRAKAEGRKPAGMNAEITQLFPDSFEDSELGPIPKGWKVTQIGEICEFAYGKGLKASERVEGPVAVYGSNGQVGWHNEKLVDGPGVVVGRKGNPGIVTWVQGDFYPIDTTFYVVSKRAGLSLNYLFYALERANLPSLAADSAVPGLNRNMAYMTDTLLPSQEVLEAFDKYAATVRKKVHSNEEQSQTLASIRDALLLKLLAGEIRVKDVDRLVE